MGKAEVFFPSLGGAPVRLQGIQYGNETQEERPRHTPSMTTEIVEKRKRRAGWGRNNRRNSVGRGQRTPALEVVFLFVHDPKRLVLISFFNMERVLVKYIFYPFVQGACDLVWVTYGSCGTLGRERLGRGRTRKEKKKEKEKRRETCPTTAIYRLYPSNGCQMYRHLPTAATIGRPSTSTLYFIVECVCAPGVALVTSCVADLGYCLGRFTPCARL